MAKIRVDPRWEQVGRSYIGRFGRFKLVINVRGNKSTGYRYVVREVFGIRIFDPAYEDLAEAQGMAETFARLALRDLVRMFAADPRFRLEMRRP